MDSDEETTQNAQKIVEDLFGSDDENDDEPQSQSQQQSQEAIANDAQPTPAKDAVDEARGLFGDSDDEAEPPQEAVAAAAASADGQQPILSDSEDEAYKPYMVQPTHSKLCVPAFSTPNPSATLCMLKLPHFMGMSMDEYHPATYVAEDDRMKFPKAATVMRWRYKRDSNGELVLGSDGRPIRESNARMVRWSDGTTQLMVGDDVYNVAISQIKNRNSYLYATLRSDAPRIAEDAGLDPQLDLGRSKENGEHEWHNQTDVEMRSILECHGQITTDAKIVPTGLQSEQHKRLAMEVRKHSLKTNKVRELGKVTMDPEKQSALTAEARKLTIKRQRKEQTLSRRGRPAMNIAFLEEGMDDDTSVARIKSRSRDRYQSQLDDTGEDLKDFIVDEDEDEDEGDYEEGDYDESDQEEEDQGQGDDEEEDEFDDNEDDEEEEATSSKPKEKKRKPQAASSSSGDAAAQQKRRKRIVDDDEEED